MCNLSHLSTKLFHLMKICFNLFIPFSFVWKPSNIPDFPSIFQISLPLTTPLMINYRTSMSGKLWVGICYTYSLLILGTYRTNCFWEHLRKSCHSNLCWKVASSYPFNLLLIAYFPRWPKNGASMNMETDKLIQVINQGQNLPCESIPWRPVFLVVPSEVTFHSSIWGEFSGIGWLKINPSQPILYRSV